MWSSDIVHYNTRTQGPSGSHTERAGRSAMGGEWNERPSMYRQIRDRGGAGILDGLVRDGDPLPSVRSVSPEDRVNPLTVLEGYQQLLDEDLVATKRDRGIFVR